MQTPDQDGLTIELEDAATRSWWVGLAGLLGAGVQQWHFVAKSGDEVRYGSETFSQPYSWGRLRLGSSVTPEDDWSPGMTEALDHLRARIEDDGWVVVAQGPRPWEIRYRRTA